MVRVCVKYFNHKENKLRFTDRAVRSLVKLFSINDSYFMQDMAKVEKLMANLRKDEVTKKVEPTKLLRNKEGTYRVQGTLSITCKCCCHGHCKLSVHAFGGALRGSALMTNKARLMSAFPMFMSAISSNLQKSMNMKTSTLSPASCLTSGMASMTCSWPLRPTSTWGRKGFQMWIYLPQFLPLKARVGLRPILR